MTETKERGSPARAPGSANLHNYQRKYNRVQSHPGDVEREPHTVLSGLSSSMAQLRSQLSQLQQDFMKLIWSPQEDTPSETRKTQYPIGFSFSPAGLLLPYHLGVATYLQSCCYLTPFTPLAGASAGSLVLFALACGVDMNLVMQLVFKLEDAIRTTGAYRHLHANLVDILRIVTPENSVDLINTRPGKVSICATQVWPKVKGLMISRVQSIDELHSALAASCNIPFYFSKWPVIYYQGRPCIDGYFAHRKSFGCPPTSADRDIYVVPFQPTAVGVHFPLGNCISPDLCRYDAYLIETTKGQIVDTFFQFQQKHPLPHRETDLVETIKAHKARIEQCSFLDLIVGQPSTPYLKVPSPCNASLRVKPESLPDLVVSQSEESSASKPPPCPSSPLQNEPSNPSHPTLGGIPGNPDVQEVDSDDKDLHRFIEDLVFPQDGDLQNGWSSRSLPDKAAQRPTRDISFAEVSQETGVFQTAYARVAKYLNLDPAYASDAAHPTEGGRPNPVECTPSRLPKLTMTANQLFKCALGATTDETLVHIFECGVADAHRWVYLEIHGYPDAVCPTPPPSSAKRKPQAGGRWWKTSKGTNVPKTSQSK